MREYTGLRYVPIFEGEFIPNKAYENLSIVQYQSEIYMSKQPTNGEAITNTEYWVKMPWNDYTTRIAEVTDNLNRYKAQNNSSVAALQKELDDLGLQVQEMKGTAPQFTINTESPEIMNYIPRTVNNGDNITVFNLLETYPAIFNVFRFLRQVYWLSPAGERTLVYDFEDSVTDDGEVLPRLSSVFPCNATYKGGTFLLIYCNSSTDTLNDINTIVYPVPQLGCSGAGRDGGEPQFYTKLSTTSSQPRYYNSIILNTGNTHINYVYNFKTYLDQMAQRLDINISRAVLNLSVNHTLAGGKEIIYTTATDAPFEWANIVNIEATNQIGLQITIYEAGNTAGYKFMYPVQ